jgi:hypothetical protein
MSYLVVVQDENTNIVSVAECATHGEASRVATECPKGQRARIVPKEDNQDVLYWYNQIKEKRDMGFIPEYGIIPNGNRSKGEGARGIGRMIFPAYGGMLEGVTEATLPAVSPGKSPSSPPPSPKNTDTGCEFCDHDDSCECEHPQFSSTGSEEMDKKLETIWEKMARA